MELLVFISYATPDSENFQIANIAENLKNKEGIADVLYWEKHMDDDIMEYMNENLAKCDIIVVFCSEDSIQSESVKLEWMSGLKLKKKVIPIFTKPEHIPPLLTTKLGIEFIPEKIEQNIDKIYSLILKKNQGVEINIADSDGGASLTTKQSLDMDIEDLATKVAEAMFSEKKEIILGKNQYWIKKYKSNGVRFTNISPYRFLEQNPKKSSEYAKMAQKGHKVMWVTKNGAYFARWIDGQFVYLGN